MFHWNICKERQDIMAVNFELRLSDSDFQKLVGLKKADGRFESTFNDYAEALLGITIRRMYREYDRQGRIKEAEYD